MEKKYNSRNDFLKDSNVGWNASNLFYIYLNGLDLDYTDSFYDDNWRKMLKVFKLKYMKVDVFITKFASDEEKELLDEEDDIKNITIKFKDSNTDFGLKHNSDLIEKIIIIIENKMRLLDRLMSKAGMNVYLEKAFDYKPSALGGDDF